MTHREQDRLDELEAQVEELDCDLDEARDRISELEELCSELYQVIGVFADVTKTFEQEKVQKVLDNASQARIVHDDVMPFYISVAQTIDTTKD